MRKHACLVPPGTALAPPVLAQPAALPPHTPSTTPGNASRYSSPTTPQAALGSQPPEIPADRPTT